MVFRGEYDPRSDQASFADSPFASLISQPHLKESPFECFASLLAMQNYPDKNVTDRIPSIRALSSYRGDDQQPRGAHSRLIAGVTLFQRRALHEKTRGTLGRTV